MKFEIEKVLAEKVMNYLAQRPWIEVKDLLAGMMAMKLVEEPTEAIEEPTHGVAKERDESSAD